MKKKILALAVSAVIACGCTAAFTGCGGGDESGELTPVTLQLKWLRQSQFMGYYAADVLGFYEEEGLDVTIVEGGTTSEIDAVESGAAQFGTTWVSNLMPSIANGSSLMAIAQFYQDSGMTAVSLKTDTDIADGTTISAGESVGNWLGGNQYELQAYLASLNLDTELTSQSFDMNQLLSGSLDWASAMTYNELGLVLEAGYDLDDLNVIYMRDTDVSMMEDCLFVDANWAAENTETVEAFLRASIKGWAWACTHAELTGNLGNDTGSLVYQAGDSVSLYHQQYMATEVAKLVVDGTNVTSSNLNNIGIMNENDFEVTRDILSNYYTSSTASTTPSQTDIATQAALAELTFDQVFYTQFWDNVHSSVDLSDLDSYTYSPEG